MKIFNFIGFINEKYLTWLETDISIRIDIEASRHTLDRFYRHGISRDERIHEHDIIDVLERAIEKITYAIIDGKLRIKEAFIVKDINSDLHIVCNLYPTRDSGCLKLVLITVMKKHDFAFGKNQFFIEI